MTLKEKLLAVANVYAATTGLSRARVSTVVLNRGATLEAISDGRADVTTGTYERAMRWFSENWPAGAEWPLGVERPVPEAAE